MIHIVNPKFRLVIVLTLTLWTIIIGLAYSAIGYADQPTEEERIQSISEQLKESTVKITPFLEVGSGFYIAPEQIITNWHVVKDAGPEVKIYRSNGAECTAKVGYREEKWDLALLSTACKGTPIPFASENPKLGTTVLAMGNPARMESFLSKGIVSGTFESYLMFDAFIYHGSSGGPLVNVHNELVGVVTAMAKEHQGIGAAVSVEDVKRFLQRANN